MSRLLLFTRKTMRDCMQPKLLLAFLVPYFGLSVLISGVLAPDDVGGTPLFTQEQQLIEAYSQLSFAWLVPFPLVFVAILTAIVVAGESEEGTLRILLSKPVHRWELLAGKFLGVALVGILMILAGLLVGAVALLLATGADSAALGDSILALLPGTLLYAAVVVFAVTALGVAVSVWTKSRLQTVLVTALAPVLFYVFTVLQLLQVGEIYKTYYLYIPDLSYHFGTLYVLIQGAIGPDFTPETQDAFASVSGVYDAGAGWYDPLLGGIVGDVPLSGYVPQSGSVILIAAVTGALLAVAFVLFERMDVQ